MLIRGISVWLPHPWVTSGVRVVLRTARRLGGEVAGAGRGGRPEGELVLRRDEGLDMLRSTLAHRRVDVLTAALPDQSMACFACASVSVSSDQPLSREVPSSLGLLPDAQACGILARGACRAR